MLRTLSGSCKVTKQVASESICRPPALCPWFPFPFLTKGYLGLSFCTPPLSPHSWRECLGQWQQIHVNEEIDKYFQARTCMDHWEIVLRFITPYIHFMQKFMVICWFQILDFSPWKILFESWEPCTRDRNVQCEGLGPLIVSGILICRAQQGSISQVSSPVSIPIFVSMLATEWQLRKGAELARRLG